MTLDLLKQLRDIHYPPPISFWPPAIGWYFVGAILLIALGVMGYYIFRRWSQQKLKRAVLKRLLELEQENNLTHAAAAELSVLLKRCALARFPRQQVAGLHGEQWLHFLDATSLTTEFTNGVGRMLVVYPYRSSIQALPTGLFDLIRDWVKKNV